MTGFSNSEEEAVQLTHLLPIGYSISLIDAISIGIGGMVGAGISSILVVLQDANNMEGAL